MKDLSIVVPTHNKWPRLRLSLVSYELINYENFEVIIVDDGSDDGTAEGLALYQAHFSIRVVRNDFPTGRAAARNLGLQLSQGKRVLFLDDDCLVTPEIVNRHSLLSKNQVGHGTIYNMTYLKFFLDPANGTLYPEFLGNRNYNGMKEFCINEELIRTGFDRIISLNRKINALERLTSVIFGSKQYRHLSWIACAGANLSVDRSVGETILFDSEYGLNWGAEDLDYGLQLFQSGYEILPVSGAEIYHMDHVRTNFLDKVKSSFALFKSKHPVYSEIDFVCSYLTGECNLNQFLAKNMK